MSADAIKGIRTTLKEMALEIADLREKVEHRIKCTVGPEVCCYNPDSETCNAPDVHVTGKESQDFTLPVCNTGWEYGDSCNNSKEGDDIMGVPRGNMDSDFFDAIGLAQAGESLVAITAGSILKFSDKMLIRYMKKIARYGHSWLKKPLKESEKAVLNHLQDHWELLKEEEFQSDHLVGLGLMAMMVVQLREIQESNSK